MLKHIAVGLVFKSEWFLFQKERENMNCFLACMAVNEDIQKNI